MSCKVLGLVFVSVFPFLFHLDGDFVFDDSEAVTKNEDVKSSSWITPFYNDFWGTSITSNFSHKSYRPLTILSFKINYVINNHSLSALQFKATNLICHVICCLLVWVVFDIILKDVGLVGKRKRVDIAYCGAVLFGVHPVHVEAVCGVVGRADLLAALTFFLAFITYNQAMKLNKVSYIYLITTFHLSGISMLFKENGITALGFCIMYEFIIKIVETSKVSKTIQYKINFTKSSAIRMVMSMIALLLLLFGRWMIMGGTKPQFKSIDNPAAFSDSLFTRIATFNYIYFLNLLILIWPEWLCYDWSMGCVPLLKDYLDFRILMPFAIYLYGLLLVCSLVDKRNHISGKRATVICLSLGILPFLPASNIFYPVGFVIAERILYIPSAGYCLLIAIGLNELNIKESGNKYKLSLKWFYFVILLYELRSFKRSFDWQNEYNLFISGLKVCPLNAKVHYNVAKVADAAHQSDWAMAEYKEAIRLFPEYYQAMNNLANLMKNHKQFHEAEMYLRSALSYKRDFPAAWMNLGIVLASLNRHNESLEAYKTALEYRKEYPVCYYNLGNLYLEMNQVENALESWSQAIHFNSSHLLAWTNMLALLDNSGQLERALEVIPKALSVLPDSASINFAVANIYGKLERYEDAEKYFKNAVRLFGDQVQALHYANFGVLYHRWKKYKLAVIMYEKALSLDPSYKSAQKNLSNLKKTKKISNNS